MSYANVSMCVCVCVCVSFIQKWPLLAFTRVVKIEAACSTRKNSKQRKKKQQQKKTASTCNIHSRRHRASNSTGAAAMSNYKLAEHLDKPTPLNITTHQTGSENTPPLPNLSYLRLIENTQPALWGVKTLP